MRSRLAPIFGCLIFLLAGLTLLPYPGLQNDELFFAGPIYAADSAFYNLELGTLKIPLMVMSYSGALKTWLYAGLFRFLAADQWSVRIPVLLMGLGTIWLTWVWVRRLAGPRAAAVAVAFLSTDTMFLMTNLFDWGPVAIQHLLLMAGLVCAPQNLILAAAFWGLGLWDKALLIWPLIALGLASFFLFPKEFLARLRQPRTVMLALGSFFLAASPLVWYNVARHGETASQNTHFNTTELSGKSVVLEQTVDGSVLFNYMISQDNTNARPPRTLIERASLKLAGLAGDHQTNWMIPAWIASVLLAFTLWKSPHFRLILFLLLTTLLIWLQMALTKNTGGAAHHSILLWPFPAVILGIVFSEIASRIPRFDVPILWTVVTVLCVQNLLNTNQYLSRFTTNGPTGGWTDALYRLAEVCDHKSASWYGLVDWGYLNGLRLLHEGDLPVFIPQIPAEGHLMDEVERAELVRQLGSQDFVFVQHTQDKQMFPGINERFRKAAAELGYKESLQQTVPDRNGRPVFELLRFQKQGT